MTETHFSFCGHGRSQGILNRMDIEPAGPDGLFPYSDPLKQII